MDQKTIISLLLGAVSLVGLIGAFWTRISQGKGLGWKFLRFTTIVVALPLAAILNLHGALSEAVVAIIAASLGYVFGKSGSEVDAKGS